MQILNEIAGVAIMTDASILPLYFILLFAGIITLFAGISKAGTGRSFGLAVIMIVVGGALTFSMLLTTLFTPDVPTGEYTPTRYEVVLTDENYIIDASKYRIIEKRGEIILLEEVKEAAK